MPSPIVLRREVDVPFPPAQVWAVVADTEQLNRDAGMPGVTVEPADRGAARFVLRGKQGPFTALWDEPPYEFVENERLSIARAVRGGLVTWLSFSAELEPRGSGTRVRFAIGFVPRWFLAGPLFARGTEKTLDGFVAALRRLEAPPVAPPPDPRLPEVVAALRAAGVGGELAARIAGAALHEPDATAARLRPYELADRWALPRRDVLTAMLQAVVAGVLDLRWEVICPGCRTGSQVVQGLEELEDHGHCQLCDIEFQLDMDRSLEATFRPVRSLRALDVGPYCIGGPARMPHVVAQAIVEPGAEVMLPAPLAPGRYRLTARGGAAAAVEVAKGAPARAALACGNALAPAAVRVAPGGALAVLSRRDGAFHVRLERLAWSSLAATAHDLTLLPAFRRTFSARVLRRGLSLRVERVALLFTDLTGSTELYARAGDAAAFAFVDEHFQLLEREVEAHGGTLVKTIGDAVMAAFGSDEAALRCALSARVAFELFRRDRGVDVGLKLGVHSGPCYAVTANDRLDYFGHTVNVAARLQGQAGAGEIVISAEAAERAGLQVPALPFAARLKGLAAPLPALRVEPSGVLARSA